MSSPPIPTVLTPQSEKHNPKHSPKPQKPAPIARIARSGTVLGEQWEILAKLGHGAMADVFRAFSEILQQDRVVKVLVLDPNACNADELIERFRRECSVLTRVSHPHLVKAFNFSSATEGQPAFYTMEHIEGASLKELTDLPLPGEKRQHGGGPLSEERALRIMLQICEAIMALHEAGVYHRDLKPGNIMVSPRDGRDHATLIDLGICKCTPVWHAGLKQRTPVEQRFETETGRDLGTPGFMGAGEYAELASRDVFGLCATLFKTVLGRIPYRPEPTPGEVLRWRPADDDRVSESLKLVLEKGLQAEPAARYPSVARLHEELGYVLQEVESEQSDHGESHPRPGVGKGKDAPKDKNDAWILEPVHAALDVARKRLEHAAQETDGVEAALLEPVSTTVPEDEIDGAKAAMPIAVSETPEPEPEHAALDDGRREGERHAANEIDGAKAAQLAAVAETVVLEREPTGKAAKPLFVRRVVVGALACVGISIGLGWHFLGGTPRTSIADSADFAAAGIVAERATAEAALDRDSDHALVTPAAAKSEDGARAPAMPAEITPKEDDARSSGLRRPVAEPTTPSRRHALTKASFRQVLETKRSVLDKCSQLLEVGAVADAIVRISASGEVTRVRLSPSLLVETCVRDAIGDLRFPATGTASTHRVRLRHPAQK